MREANKQTSIDDLLRMATEGGDPTAEDFATGFVMFIQARSTQDSLGDKSTFDYSKLAQGFGAAIGYFMAHLDDEGRQHFEDMVDYGTGVGMDFAERILAEERGQIH